MLMFSNPCKRAKGGPQLIRSVGDPRQGSCSLDDSTLAFLLNPRMLLAPQRNLLQEEQHHQGQHHQDQTDDKPLVNALRQPYLHGIEHGLQCRMPLCSKVLKSSPYLDHRIHRQQHKWILKDVDDLRRERLLELQRQGLVEGWYVGADHNGSDGRQPQSLTNLAEEER